MNFRHLLTLSFFCITILLFTPSISNAQSEKIITLKKTIAQARANSLDYKVATNTLKTSYWDYQNYISSYLPKLSLSGQFPQYYRSSSLITLPDGQQGFVKQNLSNSSLNLDLSQEISLTGGNLSIGSRLNRIDNFGDFNNTVYTTVPFTINYRQDNIFYNQAKWQKKIEPLKLQESQKGYLESLEEISFNTVDQFFDLLLADVQYKLDSQNFKNIDTLLKITEARYGIGTVNLNDILQAKVSLLNASASLKNSESGLEIARQKLSSYLNSKITTDNQLEIPDSIRYFDIILETAQQKAKENRKFAIESKRKKIEADQIRAKAIADSGPSFTIAANIGVSQTDKALLNSYRNLLGNQSISIGFSIPLISWGVNKTSIKRAAANIELQKANLSQQEILIDQEINAYILKWKQQRELITISKNASIYAKQRYGIAKQKYQLGSLNYTDFNNAQLEKDRSIIVYINSLKTYWSLFYNIRKSTLYDFDARKNLDFNLEIN